MQELDHINDFYNEHLSNLGYSVAYGVRTLGGPEPHTIAIAYKSNEWFLIDQEHIDLGRPKQWFPNDNEFKPRSKNGLICQLQHNKSRKIVVVANAHFDHLPEFDEVKYAQAVYFLEQCAKYIRVNKGMEETLPFICGGDFNSLPISSVLSVFYGEDIEDYQGKGRTPSRWTIPGDLPPSKLRVYSECSKRLRRMVSQGSLDPLLGTLASAYECYDLPVGRVPHDQTLKRDETMPRFTNYKEHFQGTLDHIFYNKDKFEVLELLEVPSRSDLAREKAIPSTIFPSDHLRIESVFLLK